MGSRSGRRARPTAARTGASAGTVSAALDHTSFSPRGAAAAQSHGAMCDASTEEGASGGGGGGDGDGGDAEGGGVGGVVAAAAAAR